MKAKYYLPKEQLFNDPDDFYEHYDPWCREDAEIAFAKFQRLDPKSYGCFFILTPGLNRLTGIRA